MKIEVKQNVALIQEPGVLITDPQSALDLIATVKYETGCAAMALPKEAVTEDFWKLSNRLAGEILQKFINYQMRIAIYGDFSALTAASKSLHDFVYESNQGTQVIFAESEAQALTRLHA